MAVGSGKGESFDFDLPDFSQHYNFQAKTVYVALKFLERQAYITLSEGIHAPSKVRIRMNGNDLYKFQVANSRYDVFIKYLLRTYSGLFDGFVSISLSQIAQAFKSELKQVHLMLLSLRKLEVIDYQEEKSSPPLHN